MRECFSLNKFNSNKYVKNKIEPLGARTYKTKMDEYAKPIFEHEPYNQEGTISGTVGDLSIKLSYTPEDKENPRPNVRKLNQLVLKNKTGEELDVLQLLPKNHSIYFTTLTEEDETLKSSADYAKKAVFVGTPLLTSGGLMTLMHEIGHMDRNNHKSLRQIAQESISTSLIKKEMNFVQKILSGFRSANMHDAAVTLNDERDAWSFALAKLRPFFNALNINMEDIKNIVHKNGLHTYSKAIRLVVDKNL